jgi:hypothetical protein
MNNPLLTVRVPPYIIHFVDQLDDKSNRTKTDVVITLLESCAEFKEFQREQGIPEREPTTNERLDDIQAQLQALQDAYQTSQDSSILSTIQQGLQDVLDKADSKEKGYQKNSFTQGLADIKALHSLLEQHLY